MAIRAIPGNVRKRRALANSHFPSRAFAGCTDNSKEPGDGFGPRQLLRTPRKNDRVRKLCNRGPLYFSGGPASAQESKVSKRPVCSE